MLEEAAGGHLGTVLPAICKVKLGATHTAFCKIVGGAVLAAICKIDIEEASALLNVVSFMVWGAQPCPAH